MFKLVIACALLGCAFADVKHLFGGFKPQAIRPVAITAVRPVPVAAVRSSGPVAQILRQESDISPEGNYQWAYETDNGISAQEQASFRSVGPEEAIKSAQGSFGWTSPEGEQVSMSYIADENGYQPQGSHLPVAPPVPAAILRALDWIAAHPHKEEVYQARKPHF